MIFTCFIDFIKLENNTCCFFATEDFGDDSDIHNDFLLEHYDILVSW